MPEQGRVLTDTEWAASLTVADVDALLHRCLEEADMTGLDAALRLMAVKDPRRAEQWVGILRFGVEVARA